MSILLVAGIACSSISYVMLRKKWRKYLTHKKLNMACSTNLPSNEEIELRNNQYVALSALVLSGVATITYPVIIIGIIPFFLYNYFYIIKYNYIAFRNKGNVILALFEIISVTLGLLIGTPWVMALLFMLVFSANRLIMKNERQTKIDFSLIFGELPEFVWLLKENTEISIPLNQLQVSDVIVVHAGETIPVDGQIQKGEGKIDQHLLTGEFQPIEKKPDDNVFSSTLLLAGTLQICVQQRGIDTIAGQIAKTLQNTTDFKLKVQSRGQRIVEKGATRTLLASACALPFFHISQVAALSYSGFGYQMRMAAPLMVFNYLKLAMQAGILIKDGRALHEMADIDTMVFDKTGTLTEEMPRIIRMLACENFTEKKLLLYAASAEQRQKHPIGLAICKYAEQTGVDLLSLVNSDYIIGHGLSAELLFPDSQITQTVLIGSQRFTENYGIFVPENIQLMQTEANELGHSVVYISSNDKKLIGVIELGPTLRPKARETIQMLHACGINTYIISGDQEKPTCHLAKALGVKHYFSETLPEDKANIIAGLQSEGKKVCFIGDGINDSVALTKANVSISLQSGAAIAQDAADIVLISPKLLHINYLLEVSADLNQRMDRSEFMNTLFSITCVTGILILGMGINGAMLLYSGGVLVSTANAMLPLLKHRKLRPLGTMVST